MMAVWKLRLAPQRQGREASASLSSSNLVNVGPPPSFVYLYTFSSPSSSSLNKLLNSLQPPAWTQQQRWHNQPPRRPSSTRSISRKSRSPPSAKPYRPTRRAWWRSARWS
ncbi:hypothetical protein DL98DRAFT_265711 [Cadophora sp. DSE1049]|nr:hypothetical protein DL98DRAFT_265711 [Cadophora sp. DSE1049]